MLIFAVAHAKFFPVWSNCNSFHTRILTPAASTVLFSQSLSKLSSISRSISTLPIFRISVMGALEVKRTALFFNRHCVPGNRYILCCLVQNPLQDFCCPRSALWMYGTSRDLNWIGKGSCSSWCICSGTHKIAQSWANNFKSKMSTVSRDFVTAWEANGGCLMGGQSSTRQKSPMEDIHCSLPGKVALTDGPHICNHWL